MRKIGVMGGTFDPIHVGHLMLAEWARSAAGLEEVWIMPTGQSYLKADRQVLPGAERLHMAELAAADNELLKCIDLEIQREGYTYTYETMEQLKAEHPDTEFFFIQGADCLFTMENWKYPERIFESCTVLAAVRGNADLEALEDKRQELTGKYGGNIVLLPFMQLSISSSEIRDRIKEGLSVRYMVPDRVLEYIEKRGFYCEEIGQKIK